MQERMTAPVDYADAHKHADAHKIDAPADNDKKSPAATEHQLLHAIDHLQLFPGAISGSIFTFLPVIARYHFTPQNVALATFEAPFRPPSLPSLS